MVHSSHQHATRLAPSVGQGHNIPSMSPVGFPHLPPVPDYLRSPELRPTHPPYQPTTLPNRIASGYSNRKIVLKYPINREMSSRGGKLAPEVNRYVRMFLSRSRSDVPLRLAKFVVGLNRISRFHILTAYSLGDYLFRRHHG